MKEAGIKGTAGRDVMHYYNAISGTCACGAVVKPGEKCYSVFPDKVTCANCLKLIRKSEGK